MKNKIPKIIKQNQKPKASKLPRDGKGRFLGGIAQETNKHGTAGRPTVFTDEVQDQLVYALSTGQTIRQATMYAGVSVRAFHNFVKSSKVFKSRVQKYINALQNERT